MKIKLTFVTTHNKSSGFNVGDTYEVLEKYKNKWDHWFYAIRNENGNMGYFINNFVKEE